MYNKIKIHNIIFTCVLREFHYLVCWCPFSLSFTIWFGCLTFLSIFSIKIEIYVGMLDKIPKYLHNTLILMTFSLPPSHSLSLFMYFHFYSPLHYEERNKNVELYYVHSVTSSVFYRLSVSVRTCTLLILPF